MYFYLFIHYVLFKGGLIKQIDNKFKLLDLLNNKILEELTTYSVRDYACTCKHKFKILFS